MAKYYPTFVITALTTCLLLCLSDASVDLSRFSCPETCSTRRGMVTNDCIKYGIIGCFTRTCKTSDGKSGISCTLPTPVPTACPGICRLSKRRIARECREFHFLRCSVEKCQIPDPDGGVASRGYSCADPTPTPTACTEQCRGTELEATVECRKLVLLGCSVRQCIALVPDRPSKLGFTCATPTPTPTACPDVCMAFEAAARDQCKDVTALGIDCNLASCANGRGFICQEPTPAPVACPAVCIPERGDVVNQCETTPDSLNCEVRRCDVGFGRRMYSCSSPTPTPTACPGICYGSAELAFEECFALRGLGLGCNVERCAAPEGTGFSCGPRVIDPDDGVLIDDVDIGEDLRFSLNLTVAPGAGVRREDLYLLTDATGSMRAEIATVRNRFNDIIEARRNASADVQFGVGFYRDESEGANNGFFPLQSITDDADAVMRSVNTLRATGGGDQAEANLVALYKLATDPTIGWRPGSRRIIVMLGDNPGHEPSCVPGAPTLTRQVVRDALVAEGITLLAVSFAPSLDGNTRSFGCSPSTSTGSGQASFIATGTMGEFITSTSSRLIEAIEEAVGSLSLMFEVDTSDCDDALTSTYDPSFPIEVEAGETITVLQQITLLPGICDAGRTFSCQIRYTASGSDSGTLNVTTSNVMGCV